MIYKLKPYDLIAGYRYYADEAHRLLSNRLLYYLLLYLIYLIAIL